MKLFNQILELETIKSICTNKKDATTLLGSLDSSYFFTEIGKQAFERISFIAKEKATIVSWSSLMTDPTLPETTREALVNFNAENPEIDSNYKELVKNLTEYKKARTLLKISEKIQDSLLKENIDINQLFTNMAEKLAEVKSGKDLTDCFTRIGDNSNTKERLDFLLKGEIRRFLPTGFEQWDKENGGVPIGKLGIIAATSGGGKSLCAEQLCINMGTRGVRTCLVPLEMNATDMLQRFLANKTSLNMSEINKLSPEQKEKAEAARKEFEKFEKILEESATSIDLFNPPEDITMEDLLMILKPFDYDVILIDYIGLLKGFDDDNQWRKMGAAARYAKIWAETNNTTVLCLAQLSEDMVIRYSRAMKEHADFMWTWSVSKLNELEDGKAIIKVEPQKGRNQAQQNFYLKVDYKKMSMIDATPEEIEKHEESLMKKLTGVKTKKATKKSDNVGIKSGSVDNELFSDL